MSADAQHDVLPNRATGSAQASIGQGRTVLIAGSPAGQVAVKLRDALTGTDWRSVDDDGSSDFHLRTAALARAADLGIVVASGQDRLSRQTSLVCWIYAVSGLRRLLLIATGGDGGAAKDRDEEVRAFAERLGFEMIQSAGLAADEAAPPIDLLQDLEQHAPNRQAVAHVPDQSTDQFQAHVIWMSDHAMVPGRPYDLRVNGTTVAATVTAIKYRLTPETEARNPARSLNRLEIGVCNLSTRTPVPFSTDVGAGAAASFVLLEPLTGAEIGLGRIDHPLRRADNVQWQALDVTRAARAAMKDQRPVVLWFTGLSGSGKSTIANLVEKRLHDAGRHTILLDGDNVRHGLNRDLGFTEVDRVENIRRIGEVAKLMTDAGLIVLVSFISPFRSERQLARSVMADGEFVEVFVDTPIEECIRRDPKGLYKKALAGAIANFTGISSPYEAPESPELRLDTVARSADALSAEVLTWLADRLDP